MITLGIPVRIGDEYGIVTQLWNTDDEGHRWWMVDWENSPGPRFTPADEDLLIDVEREEWADVLDGVDPADRCPSRHRGRACALRKGHRTARHRECEISWTDEQAVAR